jgi:hypothetical protein
MRDATCSVPCNEANYFAINGVKNSGFAPISEIQASIFIGGTHRKNPMKSMYFLYTVSVTFVDPLSLPL